MGPAITVSTHEITNEPHRTDPSASRDLVDMVTSGVRFLPPLVSRTPSGRLMLLGGQRRFYATVDANLTRMKVYVTHDVTGLLAWLVLDAREEGRGRMSRSEIGRFSAKALHQLSLNSRQISHLDRVLGDIYDYDAKTVQDARQLINRLYSYPPGSASHDAMLEDLALVDLATLRPSSAVSRDVQRHRIAQLAAGAPPAVEQGKTFARVLPGLRGTIEALREIGPVSYEVPKDVRDKAEKELREAARVLASIVKNLKAIRESA